MSRKRWMLGLLLPAVMAAGCDRSSRSTASTSGSPSNSSATPVVSKQTPAAATKASAKAQATQPAESWMSIAVSDAPNEPPMMVKFPAAKVRLKKTAEGMQVFLYTDDPPEATSKDYKGNAYSFEMELAKVTEPAELTSAQYRYHVEPGSAGADRAVETTNGIFLNGWDTHLQPADVMVAFEGESPRLIAKVVGTFRIVTAEKADGPPRLAMVQAMLPVSVEGK